MNLTAEQSAAIAARGKVIVSASAGSGKTFVMIEKLVQAIIGGADLDEVLAVTFTKKASAQMKEKLRHALIDRLNGGTCPKERIKLQLSKISTADISTIHSFCARLIRKYFYVLGVNSDFDVTSADDGCAQEFKRRALDVVFDRNYGEENEDFKLLLKCFMKKRSDASLRRLVLEAHSAVRSTARYERLLEGARDLYTDEGYERVCRDYSEYLSGEYAKLRAAVEKFRAGFPVTAKHAVYDKIFGEMLTALTVAGNGGIFGEKPPLTVTRKPADAAEDKEAGESFKRFKDGVAKRYAALCGDFESDSMEKARFMESGKIAIAFSRLLLEFDREYAQVKNDENKLDYNDLEHLTLKLLEDGAVRSEISGGYKYVFVDEYQDVNPVQEEIISALSGETFLVGDVKQAIYGFRGSKSAFFSKKFAAFGNTGGTALKLSSNFRSTDGVLNFVNSLFSEIMREDCCGVDYKNTAQMAFGELYPRGYGEAGIKIFGKDVPEEREKSVYSVACGGCKAEYTREGLAVLEIVKSELQKQHFDLKSGKFVETQPQDICVLTRKNKGESAEGIIRALTEKGGYPVSGAQDSNVCVLPEVKQMLDVLSLIDNAEQDVPLVTALISPLGGLTEDELASIRIAADGKKSFSAGMERKTFRKCCKEYSVLPGVISGKLNAFYAKLDELRGLSDILSADGLICELLERYGLESGYGRDAERKVKNVMRLAAEGVNLTLTAFLEKIKAGGYEVSAPSSAQSGGIKIMSMHASKGLEFPVVIIADICKSFKGADYSETPFDELYGFAPKCYDAQKLLSYKTVLRRFASRRSENEDLKNELNLFYVACTRAMCRLHILAEEIIPYNEISAANAKCYAELFDASKFSSEEITFAGGEEKRAEGSSIPQPNPALAEAVKRAFAVPYGHAESVNLPVKSSASAILKASRAEEPAYSVHQLFGGEGETGTKRGTAYHRFLELCDFSVKDKSGIERQKSEFLKEGLITEEQSVLLDEGELSEILNMPAFDGLGGAQLFREREFLCRLPANEILETSATDGVLVQGAIDLLAVGDFGVKIIDYKYSGKSDAALVKTYSKQLALYKKAVSRIMRKAEDEIKTVIINVHLRRQIDIL